jgi:hypothetical protein
MRKGQAGTKMLNPVLCEYNCKQKAITMYSSVEECVIYGADS